MGGGCGCRASEGKLLLPGASRLRSVSESSSWVEVEELPSLPERGLPNELVWLHAAGSAPAALQQQQQQGEAVVCGVARDGALGIWLTNQTDPLLLLHCACMCCCYCCCCGSLSACCMRCCMHCCMRCCEALGLLLVAVSAGGKEGRLLSVCCHAAGDAAAGAALLLRSDGAVGLVSLSHERLKASAAAAAAARKVAGSKADSAASE